MNGVTSNGIFSRSATAPIGLLLMSSNLSFHGSSFTRPPIGSAVIICGFFFDILMVDRADSWHAIAQQVFYLAVIFAALTMGDFQRLRRSQGLDSAPLIAASIFLDVLNVFWFFLRIFSGSRD